MDEDGGHCFVKCKRVKEVWRKALLEHVRVAMIPSASWRKFIV
jgi:hypothetical protein